jgi:hypothetical protein
MHDQQKLDEARFFIGAMTTSVEDSMAFRFNLSAFLSAARSVLQYALEETKSKTGGQAWYNAQMVSNPVLRFFKDKRDVNIHERPVDTPATINVTVTDVIGFSDAVLIREFGADGILVTERGLGAATPAVVTCPPPSVSRRYNFPDWTGQEDVLQLCRDYVMAVESVVSDGRSKGFLA